MLDLSGSALTSLTTVLNGLPSLRSVKRLDLSRNDLASLRQLSGLPILEHLDVSSNRYRSTLLYYSLDTVRQLVWPNVFSVRAFSHSSEAAFRCSLTCLDGPENCPALYHLDASSNQVRYDLKISFDFVNVIYVDRFQPCVMYHYSNR